MIITSSEKNCYIKHPNQNREECQLLYSEHKEADHRIASHAKYANEHETNENSSVSIVADDTNVYVFLIRIACYCRCVLYFRQGTYSSKLGITYHNVTAIATELGELICTILPSFHALTGSDFTKPFFWRSKTQCFKKSIAQPSTTHSLSSLSSEKVNLSDVIDFVLHTVYNRPKREKTPGESRYAMLFVKKGKKNVFVQTKQLPPDEKSLKMKFLRTNFMSHLAGKTA